MRARQRSFLLLAAAAAVAPSALDAQGTIRGVVFDSLRNAPVVEAEVSLDGGRRITTTDRRGRFAFTDVAPGTHSVAYDGPRLDSLGITPVTQRVDVVNRRARDLLLAIPSAAAFQRVFCGGPLESGGILRGVITTPQGAPAVGAEVAARWDEPRLEAGAVVLELQQRRGRSDAAGEFALCGVPVVQRVTLRAVSGQRATGEVVVGLDTEAVLRRDLQLGAPTATAVVSGRVLRRDGRPLQATIELWGDSLRGAPSDSLGRFTLAGVPQRSGQLYVRVIGQVARVVDIAPRATALDVGDIVLEDAAVALQPMTIRERQITRERLAFEERSRGAVGVFFDSTFLASLPRVTAAALASKSTLLRVGPVGGRLEAAGETLMLRSYVGRDLNTGCYPRVYLNGTFISTQRPHPTRGVAAAGVPPDYMRELLRTAKRIEVYNAREVPAEFFDPDGCGSIAIWTR